MNLNVSESTKPYFNQLNIMTVYSLYVFETITFFVNNETSTINQKVHTYFTRRKKEIITDHHRLNLFTKKTIYTGKQFFRNIPLNIKNV